MEESDMQTTNTSWNRSIIVAGMVTAILLYDLLGL